MRKGFFDALCLAVVLAGASLVANAAPQDQPEREVNTRQIAVSGCLETGSSPNSYFMKDTQTGKVYALRSRTVDLAKHVGHKIAARGMTTPLPLAPAASAAAPKPGAAPINRNADIDVNAVKPISDSCKE